MIKNTLKLWGTFLLDHLMAFILAVILSAALAAVRLVEMQTARIILTVFTTFMHCVLLYASAQKEGGRDSNRVNYKQMKKFMLKGTAASAAAVLPPLFIYISALVKMPGMPDPQTSLGLFKVICWQNIEFINLLEFSVPLTGLVLLIPIVAATLGYLAGYYDFTLLDKLVYVKDNKK